MFITYFLAKGWHCLHNADGDPEPQGGQRRPSGDAIPLFCDGVPPATTPRLVPIQASWQTQPVDHLQAQSRVGGPPIWIQHGEYPNCPRCERTMILLAQLSEDAPGYEGWGDTLYIHWCDDCKLSHYLKQSS